MTAPEMMPSTTGAPVLSVRDLSAGYGHNQVLESVTFDVAPGRIVGIVGPNGSGKSTLLKAIVGLVTSTQGSVEVAGRHRSHGKVRTGYMPQSEQVDWSFPVSVFDVVMMGRYSRIGPLRRPTATDKEKVWQSLAQVRLTEFAGRQIGELSGGQQRRVLLARTLAQDEELLLLDEPTANLDAVTQHELLGLFKDLRNQGRTLIIATHDLSCVLTDFDLALCLNRRIIAYGPSREVLTAETLNATFSSHLLLLSLDGNVYVGHNLPRRDS